MPRPRSFFCRCVERARLTRGVLVAVTIAATAAVRASGAAEEEAPASVDEDAVTFEYAAPPSCPDTAQFLRRLAERGSVLRAPQRGTRPGRTVRVAVDMTPAGGTARLTIVDARGVALERIVSARDCDAVAKAMALVAALALERGVSRPSPVPLHRPRSRPRAPAPPAQAGARPSPEAAPAASAVEGPTAPVGIAAAAPALSVASEPDAGSTEATQSEPQVVAAPTPRTAAADDAQAVRPSEVPPRPSVPVHGRAQVWSVRTAVGAGIALGTSPGLALALSADLLVQHRLPAPWREVGLGVGAIATLDDARSTNQGRASFAIRAATMTLCPIAWEPNASFALRPCASAELGQIVASGSETLNARSETRPWAACGASASVSYALSRTWSIELQAAGLLSIDRDRFELGPQEVFATASVVGRARAALAATWP